jgi:hypothetical protein
MDNGKLGFALWGKLQQHYLKQAIDKKALFS